MKKYHLRKALVHVNEMSWYEIPKEVNTGVRFEFFWTLVACRQKFCLTGFIPNT